MNTVTDAAATRVSEIVTESGNVPVSPDAAVIIALGTVESTRLALLSFGSDGRIGNNLLAHLRSNLDFRVPRSAIAGLPAAAHALEASALFVKGRHQFKKPEGTPDGFGPDIDTFDAHKNATDTRVVITVRGTRRRWRFARGAGPELCSQHCAHWHR